MFPTRWREGFQAAGSAGRAILSFARRSALGLAGAAELRFRERCRLVGTNPITLRSAPDRAVLTKGT